jgi:serine protease AprX
MALATVVQVRRGAVAVMAAAALLAAVLAPVPARPATWLVPVGQALPAAARVLGALPVADALVVSSPVLIPGAARADEPLGWRALAPVADADGLRLDSAVTTTGAPAVWPTTRGERAVVALVDTGVAPVPALDGAVAGEIDFSGTGGGDGYGHGTFMASLIAGRGDVAPGVAPGAGVLSLKVAGPDGSTDLATVLSALQWLNGPGRAAGIRVVALALGIEPDSEGARLLERATSRLAQRGLLVVTAAGNEGPGALTAPATAPGTLSVGAVDDQGDPDRANDTAAAFSATGPDRRGVAQPDLSASGVGVVGTMGLDAVIARAHPEAVVEGRYFRGSGTSMATAITAGVAALASSARPDLDGHALEAALRAGGGVADAPAALAAVAEAPQGKALPQPPADGGAAGNGKGKGPKAGETDRWEPQAVRWGAVRWGAVRWGAVRWGAVRWGAVRWGAVRWAGDHWGDADWGMGAWDGVRWGSSGWEGERWEAVRWGAVRWGAVRWALVDPDAES